MHERRAIHETRHSLDVRSWDRDWSFCNLRGYRRFVATCVDNQRVVAMKIVLVVLMCFGAIVSSVGWIVDCQNEREHAIYLAHARGLAEVVSKARQVYSRCRAAEDPLPIEFARMLIEDIDCATISIYSKYPFPSNKTGGLKDEKRVNAWEAIAVGGQKEYVNSDRGVFQYAIPDVMNASCVKCHNSHPRTPKADWEIGDVRGIIDVRINY